MNDKDTAIPKFFIKPVQNMAASKEHGRPIFDDVEWVEIRLPGDKLTVFVDTVWRNDPETGEQVPNGGVPGFMPPPYVERWPDIYAKFKAGLVQAQSGTPLEEWPIMSASKVAELKALNIYTVENLADLTDGYLGRLGMGGRALRDQARAYIAEAKDLAQASAVAAENAELRERLARLEAMLVQPAAPQDKALEDCTDAELKEYIKRETGESVRGNPSRDTLMSRALEIATRPSEAAE